MISSDLFTDDLDQYPLPPAAVELAVRDPLPGAKVQPAVGHRDYNLAAHDLPFQVRVDGPVGPGQASSPVRLCNRPLSRRRR